MFVEWLRAGLDRPGKSQRGLADHLGVSESVVSRMLSGQRELKARELERIASYIGSPVPQRRTRIEHLPSAPVTKIAAPFVWREHGSEVMLDRIRVPLIPDERYFERPQFAVLLEGTKKFAVCVDVLPSDVFRPGDQVVVERSNESGHVETTIRTVTDSRNGLNVAAGTNCPRSSELIHRIDDVQISGKVIGFYEPA